MKNLLILGLVALLLFAVSASLSLWLNQSKETNEKETKKSAKEMSREKEDDMRSMVRPSASANVDDPGRLTASLREQLLSVKEREDRVVRRQAQISLLMEDIRTEREVIENLRKQVGSELKLVSDKMIDVEGKFAQLDRDREINNKKIEEAQKRVIDITQAEEKNVMKLASVYDSMAPDVAAKQMQSLAESGKMETAVKLLSQMKEAKAAKVLAEIADVALSAQLVEKIRGIKRSPPLPTPN